MWRLDPGPGAEDVGDVLDGGAGDDVLNGGAGVDTLFGRVGNDALDGGIGADAMFGAAGDDVYVVDNTGDVTSEASSLGGIDTVQSSVARNLTANIENLTLTGTAAIAGYGNILNNVVTGNSAANSLHGFEGDDTLNGAGGADILPTEPKLTANSAAVTRTPTHCCARGVCHGRSGERRRGKRGQQVEVRGATLAVSPLISCRAFAISSVSR